MGAGVPPRGPEPPDLADKSSQSSMASFDDTGLTNKYLAIVLKLHAAVNRPYKRLAALFTW